jgi:high-affinity K+ transport system ATPase subunit B
MLTGDNRITASVIADEAGVDDFIAEATPEDKIEVIRKLVRSLKHVDLHIIATETSGLCN